MSSAYSFVHNIMSELSANSRYKKSHVSTATPYGNVPSFQQLINNIMPKLTGHTCYEYLNLYTLPVDRLLVTLLNQSFLPASISQNTGDAVTCLNTFSHSNSGTHH